MDNNIILEDNNQSENTDGRTILLFNKINTILENKQTINVEIEPSKARNSLVRGIYPSFKGIDYSNMRMTSIGWYSATKRSDADRITTIILSEFKHRVGYKPNCVITDGTSGIGGNAISFGRRMLVNAVEILPLHVEILKEAVDKLYLDDRIKCIQGDFTEIMSTLQQDIIFIDPPWGGPNYKNQDLLEIKLGNLTMDEIVTKGLKVARMFVLKLPNNFDFENFVKKLSENIMIIKHLIKRGDNVRFQIIVCIERF